MVIAALADAPPLCAIEVEALSQAERIDVLAAAERQIAQLAGMQQKVIASLVAHASEVSDGGPVPGKQWVREDIAAVLRLSSGAARVRIENATALVERLPDTLGALAQGDISLRHATTLAEAGHHLSDDVLARVEARVLPRAAVQSVANFRASVERAVASLDRRREDEAHADARADRHVIVRDGRHGMADVRAYLPAEDARTLALGVQALADAEQQRRCADGAVDERTADQRRADAFVALAQHALTGCPTDVPAGCSTAPATSDEVPLARTGDGVPNGLDGVDGDGAGALRIRPTSEQGRRPAVHVTVALSTLLGLDDQPGELDGYGPIAAGHARRIALDPSSTWWRLITDPAGRLLDYGHTRYRPPQALIDHVAARDQHCRFPHCTRPARRTELDHVVPYGPGPGDGRTHIGNLAALCSRHHHLKHEGGWTLTGDPEGVLIWTSPGGRTYRTEPEPLPVDGTSAGPDSVPVGQGIPDGALDWMPAPLDLDPEDEAEIGAEVDRLLGDVRLPSTVVPTDAWIDDALRGVVRACSDASAGESAVADEPPPF